MSNGNAQVVQDQSQGRLLTPDERDACKKVAAGPAPHSHRALALMALDQGVTQAEASQLSGLTQGQVRYWRDKFRQQRAGIFPEKLSDVGDVDEGPITPQMIRQLTAQPETAAPSAAKKKKPKTKAKKKSQAAKSDKRKKSIKQGKKAQSGKKKKSAKKGKGPKKAKAGKRQRTDKKAKKTKADKKRKEPKKAKGGKKQKTKVKAKKPQAGKTKKK
jgi:hypothetical protein